MKQIYVVSLGCPKNLSDTEKILKKHFDDYQLTNDSDKADVIFINTCSFITAAKEESIDAIMEFQEWKKKYPYKQLIVSGCLWEQYGKELEKEIREAQFLSNKDIFYQKERKLTGNGIFAYLKIAEGCDRTCAFCTIPLFKGKHRSRKIEDILTEAKLLENQIQELIIVSQDTSYYGADLYGKPMLYELLKQLSELNFRWIRVLYFYPQNLTPDILSLIKESRNICHYIDIPFQHFSNSILRSMRRWGSYEQYKELIFQVRDILPEATIRTSLIVGFPGETQKDFEMLLKGLEELQFDRAGFFAYSDEEEALSYQMQDKIPEEEIEKRLSEAIFYQEEISEEKLSKRINKTYLTVIENYDKQTKLFSARSQLEAPEIDGVIYVKGKNIKIGDWVYTKIEANDAHNLWGSVL